MRTPTAIWDAEAVFVDELNRTRPDLQNKLFSIIHERRVQGVELKNLRYRWAAMNPATNGEDDEEEAYLGTEPLDPALADRFGFLIEVPDWSRLERGRAHRSFAQPIPRSPRIPRAGPSPGGGERCHFSGTMRPAASSTLRVLRGPLNRNCAPQVPDSPAGG
jgi:AAA domain (dynein-related subfamily)